MTIASIAALAAERRSGRHGQARGETPGGAQVQSGTDTTLLAKAVPTDIIAFYTAVVGLLAGIQKDSPDTYLPLRWILYGVTIAATVAAVLVASYFTVPTAASPAQAAVGQPEALLEATDQPPRWQPPIIETVTAAFAFAVWGLITPGSALYATLSSPVLPIIIGILTGGGALVMNIVFVPILRSQAGPRY
ncbi:hypothetical protein [Nocardia alni]|uniref:hypothetical protein n=1 Tax=Nocardia alni TaxID=2815723 RepID=UPI001C24F10E|nr:hypothetical protein [Nocardia alni]